jgi:hypothetical protein
MAAMIKSKHMMLELAFELREKNMVMGLIFPVQVNQADNIPTVNHHERWKDCLHYVLTSCQWGFGLA